MEIDWEPEPGFIVHVHATASVSPLIPARLGLAPDRCNPAEGGEIDDIAIEVVYVWPAWASLPLPLGPRQRSYWEWRADRDIRQSGSLYTTICEGFHRCSS